ncbi:MAG: hypothetical protein Q4D73_06645 [Actinomycetaceae bacterium]|nr:hypothetical protein [Actinomycetaceae bacterium]
MSDVAFNGAVTRFDYAGVEFEGFSFPSELDLSMFREFPKSVCESFLNQPAIREYLSDEKSVARRVLFGGDGVGVGRGNFKDCVSRVGSAWNDSFFRSIFPDYKVSTSWLDCVPSFGEQIDGWLVCEGGYEVALLVLDSLGVEVFECVKRDALSAVVGACVEAVNDCDLRLQPVNGVYFAGPVRDKATGFTVRWARENCVYQAVIAPVAKKATEKRGCSKAFWDFRQPRVFSEFPAEESDYLFVFFLVRRCADSGGRLRRCFVPGGVLAHLISPYVLRGGEASE